MLAAAYGWSLAEIELVPWNEVFDHIEQIHRSRADTMQWDTAAASYPHTDKKGRSQIHQSIRAYRDFDIRQGGKGSRKAGIYEAMSPEARLLAVGQSLSQGGEEWLAKRPYQAAWLEEQGISPEAAVARYNAWDSAVTAGTGMVERGITGDGSVTNAEYQ